MKRSINVLTAAVAAAGIAAVGANAEPGAQSELTAIAGQGSGRVELAPTAHDVVGAGTFDVQGTVIVHDAAANVSFTVLRRVDFVANGVCTGAVWAALPSGPTAFSTSPGGAGALHFEIARANLVDDQQFDVQWRLVGDDGSILESACLTITVK